MALSAARKRIPDRGYRLSAFGYKLDTGKTFYANALVAVLGGYLRPCTGAPGERVVGVIDIGREESVVTAGTAGATTPIDKAAVKIGIFPFAIGTAGDALTQVHVGRKVYAIDDTTVGLLPTGGRPIAGELMEIDGTDAWVKVDDSGTNSVSEGTLWQGPGSVETVAAPGAISPNTHITLLSAVDGTDAFTMADGLFIGQEKIVVVSVAGTNTPVGTVTPATPRGHANVTAVGTLGDLVVWVWTATGWVVKSAFQVTVA